MGISRPAFARVEQVDSARCQLTNGRCSVTLSAASGRDRALEDRIMANWSGFKCRQ
jgi:hypothetical protein